MFRVLVALVAAMSVSAMAQQRGSFAGSTMDEYTPDGSENQAYDGGLQFVRLRYASGLSSVGQGRLAPWAHDYPRNRKDNLNS